MIKTVNDALQAISNYTIYLGAEMHSTKAKEEAQEAVDFLFAMEKELNKIKKQLESSGVLDGK